MCPRIWRLVVVLALLPVVAVAQESVRDLKGTGAFGAFLTPGQIDRWVFDGEKGETIVAHVVSKEFDPILQLAKSGTKDDDMVLKEVDDPGNESRYMFRLPEKGQYKIRVHAYKFQGGGNYKLTVRRFQAQPLEVGKPLIGSFDAEGKSHYYFQAVKDQVLIPRLLGAAPDAWTMLDVKGQPLPNWGGAVHIEEGGECCLIASGQPDYRCDLVVREARRKVLDGDKAPDVSLQPGEMDVWSFQGKPGDFRVVEVEKKGDLHARLIYAPEEKQTDKRIARAGARPEIAFLPVASRGGRLRFAAMLGRAGRYQIQVLADTPATYKLTGTDPSLSLGWNKDAAGKLPVGGAAFYSFTAKPGQLFQATLGSQQFVPNLRLYDAGGKLVGQSGDDADALEGRITHMVVQEGTYRLQVSSLGDGGGGDYRQSLQETKIQELQIGGRGKGTLQPGTTDFWRFAGEAGQTVFLSVRSSAMEPVVSVRSPDGVRLVADQRGNAATGSLFALRLPKTGLYTVWVSSARGAGEYTVRVIDGE